MQRQLQRQLLLRLAEAWGTKDRLLQQLPKPNTKHTITAETLNDDHASHIMCVTGAMVSCHCGKRLPQWCKLSYSHTSGCLQLLL